MNQVSVAELIDAMQLRDLTPQIEERLPIKVTDVQRPGLQLTGFFEYFITDRIQILGNAERAYMESLDEEKRMESFEKFISFGNIPCIIFTNKNLPTEKYIDIAVKHNVPLLATDQATSVFIVQLMQWLTSELAPMVAIHGVLMDVFGEGLLITGESGIGKSEAALELIKRGHRLVSDDVVEIKDLGNGRLMGSAPEITRHLLEVRGIGIMDIKMLFGIESIENMHKIDQVVKFVEWDKDAEYDRVGITEEYTEILGVRVPTYTIPIRPGRNLAVITETAAINSRQKRMGYNAADELYRRVSENIAKKKMMD